MGWHYCLPAGHAQQVGQEHHSLRVFTAEYCVNDCIIAHQTKALKLVLQSPSRDSRGRVFHFEMFQVKQNYPFLIQCL